MITQDLDPTTGSHDLPSVARHRPYPDYKDSGVTWLGKVPAHWDVKRLKLLLSANDGGVWGQEPENDGVIVLRSTEQTVDGAWKIEEPAVRKITSSEFADCRLIQDDLLVTKSSGSARHIGKTTIVTGEVEALNCCYSNFMQRLRTRPDLIARFAWYVLNGELTRKQFNFISGTTTGLANLNGEIIGMVHLACPPTSEQHSILSFLNLQTAKIDALVAKKQRLIELLKEKRRALIARAVTKGIDSTVPMKDSGVHWLGEIPKSWEAKKVNRLCRVQRGASPRPIDDPIYFDDNGEYAWVRIVDVTKSERYLTHTAQRLSALGKSKSVLLEPGDLFLSVAASVGKPIITRVKCCIHDGFVYFVGLNQNREYLFYVLSCSAPYEGLGKLGTQLNLNTDIIGDIRIPVPPLDEQEAIRQHLDGETASIDDLMTKVRLAIDRLTELRTGLVSAAVTGKIDVRDAV